jgi:hypothetical protein
MSQLSLAVKTVSGSDADRSSEQLHGSIQAFLIWIDGVDVPIIPAKRSRGTHGSERRSIGFTNGPYAEIKESIGKFLVMGKKEN